MLKWVERTLQVPTASTAMTTMRFKVVVRKEAAASEEHNVKESYLITTAHLGTWKLTRRFVDAFQVARKQSCVPVICNKNNILTCNVKVSWPQYTGEEEGLNQDCMASTEECEVAFHWWFFNTGSLAAGGGWESERFGD
jgi:hypothetical protein